MALNIIILMAAMPAVLGLSLDCTSSSPQPMIVQLNGPSNPIEITSPNYPNLLSSTGPLECTWDITAIHGAQVKVTVIEAEMNEGCSDNTLTLVDDSPETVDSEAAPLKYPGLSAKCGQSNLPEIDDPITSQGVVSLKFHSSGINGQGGGIRFKILVEAVTVPESCPNNLLEDSCPNGPCCEGYGCCVLHIGTVSREIASPNYPQWSGNGQSCTYTLKSEQGSQIAVNFLDMDLPSDQSTQTCSSDAVNLVEEQDSSSSLIGTSGKSFCGQLLPNYPGPSVILSVGNTLLVNYQTGTANSQTGRGFKASVSAVNPICSTMSYDHQYGDSTCHTTCGQTYVPPLTTTSTTTTTTAVTTPEPVTDGEGNPVTDENGSTVTTPPTTTTPEPITDEQGDPVTDESGNTVTTPKTTTTLSTTSTTTMTTTTPCSPEPRKIISFTIKDEKTSEPVAGAIVNISSIDSSITQTFASYHTNIDGKVEELSSENGVYSVSVSAPGYISQDEDITVECDNIDCQDCTASFTLDLTSFTSTPTDNNNSTNTGNNTTPADPVDPNNNGTTIPEACAGAQGSVTVKDLLTGKLLSGVVVNVNLEISENSPTRILTNKVTGSDGVVTIPLTVNGEYVIDVEKEGYNGEQDSFVLSCHVDDCDSCSMDITLELEEEDATACGELEMRIHVRDTLDDPLENAKVNVYRAGQSTPLNDQPLVTDSTGEAVLDTMATGVFKVDVTAESMFGQTMNTNITCDPNHCELCAPVVVFAMEKKIHVTTTTTPEPVTDEEGNLVTDEYGSTVTTTSAITTPEPVTDEDGNLVTDEYGSTVTTPPTTTTPEPVTDEDGNLVTDEDGSTVTTPPATTTPEPVTDEEGNLVTDEYGSTVTTTSTTTTPEPVTDEEGNLVTDEYGSTVTTPATTVTTSIPVEFCYDRGSVTLVTEVFDLLTLDQIPEARVRISFEPEDGGQDEYVIARDVSLDENGQLLLQITNNGFYTAFVTAEGYKSKEVNIDVECDPDNCDNCHPTIKIALEQEFCQETYMTITVDDVATLAPISDASVQVRMKSGNSSRIVSNHLVCPADDSIREDCGYYGMTEEECSQDCCWDASSRGAWCFHKISLDQLTTDEAGKVSVPVIGRGEFTVEIRKSGYDEYSGSTSISCPGSCEECNPSLSVKLAPEIPCNGTMDMQIKIVDEQGAPVESASVSLILSSSLAGASASDVGGELVTDVNGQVSPLLFESGTYMVSVVAPGYLAKSVEKQVTVTEDVCEDLHIPLEITLETNTASSTISPECEDVSLTITVKDLLTDTPLPGAAVDVAFEESEIASQVLTDSNGQIDIPVSAMGNYKVSTSLTGYTSSEATKTVDCNTDNDCQCDTAVTLALDQPRCDPANLEAPVLLPVTVKDNLTNAWISGAIVTLTLINSLSGPSVIPVGQPLYTNSY